MNSIEIKIKIWKKDSHGLFDYEAEEDQYTPDTVTTFPSRKGKKI